MERFPLVEIGLAPTIYCTGLASVEVIDGEMHCIFYTLQREDLSEGARLVRSVTLRLIVPVENARAGMRLTEAVMAAPPAPRPLHAEGLNS